MTVIWKSILIGLLINSCSVIRFVSVCSFYWHWSGSLGIPVIWWHLVSGTIEFSFSFDRIILPWIWGRDLLSSVVFFSNPVLHWMPFPTRVFSIWLVTLKCVLLPQSASAERCLNRSLYLEILTFIIERLFACFEAFQYLAMPRNSDTA